MADWGSTSDEIISSFCAHKNELLNYINALPASHKESFIRLLIGELVGKLRAEPSEMTVKVLYDLLPQLKHNQRGELAIIIDMYSNPVPVPPHIVAAYKPN